MNILRNRVFFFTWFLVSQKIRAGKVQDPHQQERENHARREQPNQQEAQNDEIEKLNQQVKQLSGEVERLKKELTFEKMKNSNIPMQLKEIFTKWGCTSSQKI